MTKYNKDNYEALCYELNEKKKEFENANLNIFTLQPDLC